MNYCRGRARVLVINDNYRLAPWADWLYACDYGWWKYHAPRTTHMRQRWTQDKDAAEQFGLVYIASAPKPGLSRDPQLIHQGCNSGYQAINLAYHFGGDPIVLLGYDMGATGDGHWFGEHAPEIESSFREFSIFRERFPPLAADLAAEGVRVVNCTAVTALSAFPCAKLEDVL